MPFIVSYHLYRSVSRGRKPAFAERFGSIPKERLAGLERGKTVWVHAVSVGETIAAKPLLKALKISFPGIRIVLSNVTETGRSIAEKTAEVDHCVYFPFDYVFTAKRALKQVSPMLVIVVETEIWPNFLRSAKRLGIPAVLVNGRISDRSFGRYLRFRWFFRPVLSNFTSICMQTAEDARRIIAIGAEPARVHVAGNLKFDITVTAPSLEKKSALRAGYRIPGGVKIITAGSTHAGEEETVLSAYQRLLTKGREFFLVLAPRHPERAGQVAEILGSFGFKFTLRSSLEQREEEFRPGEVLLVDTVGELMGLYSISDLVFIGGSFAQTGGHNILEPASLGVPVLFGPHMHNFRESAALLLACGGGYQAKDGEELTTLITRLLDDPVERQAMGTNGMRCLLENGGATDMQMEVIKKIVKAGSRF